MYYNGRCFNYPLTAENRMKSTNAGLLRSIALAGAVCFLPLVSQGHITVWPRESNAGATEKYTLRVPTEAKVATKAAELGVPEGVIIESVAVPAGWTYEVKKKDDRIVGITWKMDIKPGEFAEFSFVARNPRDKTEIVWTLKQHFADGSVSDWTAAANGTGTRPTAITKLAPRKQ
jgi:uncharacterized protein YcnI